VVSLCALVMVMKITASAREAALTAGVDDIVSKEGNLVHCQTLARSIISVVERRGKMTQRRVGGG
jgi:hypothetical protein